MNARISRVIVSILQMETPKSREVEHAQVHVAEIEVESEPKPRAPDRSRQVAPDRLSSSSIVAGPDPLALMCVCSFILEN